MVLPETSATDLGERETKAMTLPRYIIHGFWGPRLETPEDLAPRFLQLIDRMALIDPVFGNWFWFADKKATLFTPIRNQLPKKIDDAVAKDDAGEPDRVFGYRFATLNSLAYNPKYISLSVRAGKGFASISIYSNTISLETDWKLPPDPALVTYKIFKPALLALALSFDTTFCCAFPSGGLTELWADRKFRPGWINYVAPRFAHLVTPPKSAIVEYQPNGGLLMAATNETFLTSNPKHMAVLRDIEAALAPLNALPWPVETEDSAG